MQAEREWTEAETAALDAAFEAGVREALKRGKSLYMQLTQLSVPGAGTRPMWTAYYPPKLIAADDVAEWCAHIGFHAGENDLFFPHSHVVRAARDMGMLQ